MPCWVVPAVAAEFWGVSLEHVMADVAAGRVATWTERGVLFVEVLPRAEPRPFEPVSRPAFRRSLAWTVAGAQTVVTPAERDALLTFDGHDRAASEAVAVAVDAAAEWACDASGGDDPAQEPAPDEEPADAVPASIHDEGEPAPLPDGPEEVPAAEPPVAEEPPQWESVRARVSRMRRPPPRASDAA
jgi:hypothetical protein